MGSAFFVRTGSDRLISLPKLGAEAAGFYDAAMHTPRHHNRLFAKPLKAHLTAGLALLAFATSLTACQAPTSAHAPGSEKPTNTAAGNQLASEQVSTQYPIAPPPPVKGSPFEAAFVDDGAIQQWIQTQATPLRETGACPPSAQMQAMLTALDGETWTGDQAEAFAAASRAVSQPTPPNGPAARADQVRSASVVLAKLYLCGRCEHLHLSCASGACVSPDGVIVTNHHVMHTDQDASFFAAFADGRVLPITQVLAVDETADVALVQAELPEGINALPFLPLAHTAQLGETVHCLSHPDGQFFSFTSGSVTRRYMLQTPQGATPRLGVSCEYAKGSSGGPIVNDLGQLVGIVSATRSIYYTETQDRQNNLQMVTRHCVPVESIWALLGE